MWGLNHATSCHQLIVTSEWTHAHTHAYRCSWTEAMLRNQACAGQHVPRLKIVLHPHRGVARNFLGEAIIIN